MNFKQVTKEHIDDILSRSSDAFHIFRNCSLAVRVTLLKTIAEEIGAIGEELVQTAMEETNLPKARLEGERARTIFQLNSYAAACERGDWLEARIDTADPSRTPPKPDIRKMQVPLGPVVVFGASNFPFAFSTAGGDTASALAAGCPVIVKAHPAHARTSELAAEAIAAALKKQELPEHVFIHVQTESNESALSLVTNKKTRAVAFTGSFLGGKALFDAANRRDEPIPVFAEMGSVNPVILMPEKLQQSASELAGMLAGSVTLSAGQFCTNPGLIIGIEGEDLRQFISELRSKISEISPAPMLHRGIHENYVKSREEALKQDGVDTVCISKQEAVALQGMPTIASAKAEAFLKNPVLHKEIFGPYSLVIRCKDMNEMEEVVRHTEGQLTATLMCTESDVALNPGLVEAVTNICGRFILNGVPTGVEVCLSMHHGGPYPATTDSRFTSVGADAIKRFVRPVAFQNWPDNLLPPALQNGNPLGIWRTIDNRVTKENIT